MRLLWSKSSPTPTNALHHPMTDTDTICNSSSPLLTNIVCFDSLHNGSKRIISVSGGLGLLQMISESDTRWCANENVGPQLGRL